MNPVTDDRGVLSVYASMYALSDDKSVPFDLGMGKLSANAR
jgi:hypothetical protein